MLMSEDKNNNINVEKNAFQEGMFIILSIQNVKRRM